MRFTNKNIFYKNIKKKNEKSTMGTLVRDKNVNESDREREWFKRHAEQYPASYPES